MSLSGIRNDKSSILASKSNYGGRKLHLKEILSVDWKSTAIFNRYVVNQDDKFEIFKDISKGTLTPSQIQQIDKLDINISNKNIISNQIKQTVAILLREIIPCEDLCQNEIQKFLAIGNIS